MKMSDEKKAEDKNTIFTSFSHYKLALQQAFEVIDKKQVMKQRIHTL